MWVAGIDVSTKNIDLVLIHQDNLEPPVWHRYTLTGPDAWERTRSIPFAMPKRRAAMWDTVAAIGVENPAGTHGAYTVQRAVGAVLACLPPLALVQPWRPSEWRKAVGLPGNASKYAVAQYVLEYVLERAGFSLHPEPCGDAWTWPQDAFDAYCIALATRNAIQP